MIRYTPGTSEEPAECWYTEPVNCVTCDEEWDADHEGDEFVLHHLDEEPVCFGACYDHHTMAVYEEDVEAALMDDDPLIPADDMWIPEYEVPYEFEDAR
jgi:hypothetical protein